jgi:hypothetical protein
MAKRFIKESTVITEMIVGDNGESFIIDRRTNFKQSSQLVIENPTEKE